MKTYPVTLFHKDGPETFYGIRQGRMIVHTAEEEAEAVADGWQDRAIGAPEPAPTPEAAHEPKAKEPVKKAPAKKVAAKKATPKPSKKGR